MATISSGTLSQSSVLSRVTQSSAPGASRKEPSEFRIITKETLFPTSVIFGLATIIIAISTLIVLIGTTRGEYFMGVFGVAGVLAGGWLLKVFAGWLLANQQKLVKNQ